VCICHVSIRGDASLSACTIHVKKPRDIGDIRSDIIWYYNHLYVRVRRVRIHPILDVLCKV
jgi:hypothetical protein